jgi:hypothetical protein
LAPGQKKKGDRGEGKVVLLSGENRVCKSRLKAIVTSPVKILSGLADGVFSSSRLPPSNHREIYYGQGRK